MEVLLCCGAGMSSGFLASNTRKAAKKQKIEINVSARSHSEVADYLSHIDVLLIGPHLAAELDTYKTLASRYEVPVAVIPKDVYSSLDGERLLNIVLELTEKN